MIMEYSAIQYSGFHLDGKTPWQYWVVKLGENIYYKGYDEHQIQTTNNVERASRIAKEQFALELIGFLQNFFDEKGQIRSENAGKVLPPLLGLSEVADFLDWDKRKVSTYIKRGSFPTPLTQLASGPIWTYKQIEDFRNSKN